MSTSQLFPSPGHVQVSAAVDILKLSFSKKVSRIVLVTSDADFIPAIESARSRGMKISLVTGNSPSARPNLISACDELRDVDIQRPLGQIRN